MYKGQIGGSEINKKTLASDRNMDRWTQYSRNLQLRNLDFSLRKTKELIRKKNARI